MWHRLKNGQTTYKWSVAKDVSPEYKAQINVEFKRQSVNKTTGQKYWEWYFPPSKANHLGDCDQMTLVAAIMDPRLQPILWTAGGDDGSATEESPTENEA